jgi:(p)ppGpp synthase/HD superfamily hydrolase
MAKYHITASGDAGVCKAQIKCPLGDESLHFETAAQARAAYEGIMSAPAAAIKRSLKSLDTDGLRETLFAEAHAAGMDVVAIQKAAALASELHEGQFRSAAPGEKRPPYITHPLRNAARLVRWGAEDTDQVNIAILHDVVEDSPEAFCKSRGIDFSDEQSARDELLSHIETEYGARVASGVKGLSRASYCTDN